MGRGRQAQAGTSRRGQMDGQARADGGEQCGQAGASRRAGRLAQAGAGTRQQACAARRRQTGTARQEGAGRDPQAGRRMQGSAGRRAGDRPGRSDSPRLARGACLAAGTIVVRVGSGKLREPPSRSRLHESFTNLRQGGGRPGLRSQLRRLSARARARAQICRETRCFLQRRFAKRRVSRGFLRAAAVKHRVSRCFLARTFTKRRVSRCFLRPALSNTRASRGFLLWPAAPSVHQAGRGGLRVGFRCRAGLVWL